MIEVTSRQKVSGFNLADKIGDVITDYLADHYADGDDLEAHMTGEEAVKIANRVTDIVVGEAQAAMRAALADWSANHVCDDTCTQTIPIEDSQQSGTPQS